MGIYFETPFMAAAGIFSVHPRLFLGRLHSSRLFFEGYINPNFSQFDSFCLLSVTWNQGKTTVATDVGDHSRSCRGGPP